MKNNNVNNNIDDSSIETNSQKVGRNALSVASTICLVLATLLFVISIAALFSSVKLNSEVYDAPTGEEMLNGILVYGIENVGPYDIVEDVTDYKAHSDRKEDSYTALAVGLGEYREAAICKYAYEYVGDSAAAAKQQEIMDKARAKMEVHSYADYIDKNYENFKNR